MTINFNFDPNQLASIARSVLKIGGTASVCAGAFDPSLGPVVTTLFTSVGGVLTSAGLIWSYFSHRKVSN